mgnify:CR=1 FL=1
MSNRAAFCVRLIAENNVAVPFPCLYSASLYLLTLSRIESALAEAAELSKI